MARKGKTILDLVGNTPIVRMNKLDPNPKVELYAKLEWFNPAGSVKDRITAYMIEGAEREGLLKPGMTIIEPTSGNTGIGLAMVAAVKGYRLKLIMPESMSIERRKILSAYGAEIILTPAQRGVDGAIDKAREILQLPCYFSPYFMPDQFSNRHNVRAHYETTGPEIWGQTEGRITHFIAGLGTGGTLMGAGKFLREKNPSIRIVGVEPDAQTPIQGLKNVSVSYKPEILDATRLDERRETRIEDAYRTARLLARREGLFVGISAGAIMHATLEYVKTLEEGFVVALMPDDGTKYLSTPLYSYEEQSSISNP